jgi:hypothetical protein
MGLRETAYSAAFLALAILPFTRITARGDLRVLDAARR